MTKDLTPGAQLRKAREAKNFTVDDIAEQLRLNRDVILLIERDDYTQGTPLIFVRGYLRAYAKVVDESPDEILAAFEQLGVQEREVQNALPPRPAKSLKQKPYDWLQWMTYVIGAIFIGLIIYWISLSFNSPTEETIVPPPAEGSSESSKDQTLMLEDTFLYPEQQVLLSTAVPLPLPLQVNDESNFFTPLQTQWFDNTLRPVEIKAETKPEIKIEENKANAKEKEKEKVNDIQETTLKKEKKTTKQIAELSLQSLADTWIQVLDVNGIALHSGLTLNGKTLTLEGETPFKVTVGSPTAVILMYKGKKVDLSQFPVDQPAQLVME